MKAFVCMLVPAILWTIIRLIKPEFQINKKKNALFDSLIFFAIAALLLNAIIGIILEKGFGYYENSSACIQRLNSDIGFCVKYFSLGVCLSIYGVFVEHLLRKRDWKAWLVLLFATELVFVLTCVGLVYKTSKNETNLYPQVTGVMQKENNKYVLPQEEKGKDSSTSVLYYWCNSVPAGTYRVDVFYNAENNQTLGLHSTNEKAVKGNRILLDYRQNTAELYVTVEHPVDTLWFTADYKGNGDFAISIDVNRTPIGYVRCIVAAFILFSIAEILLVCFNKKPESKKTVFILLAISTLAFLPYMICGIKSGHDFSWHFVRIEGLAEEIKNGQFPVYMQSSWLNGYGIPVSVYYGDFLLYIPALLRVAGFSFTLSYKAFVFTVNALTALLSYYSFLRIFKKKNIAYVLTFVYVCAPYRLIDIYVRFAVGEYSAIMFLPLVCCGFYEIVAEKPGLKAEILLGVGMAGIFASHSLSAEMIVIILIILCVILRKRILVWERIKSLLRAIVFFALSGAFYIVPFVDSYLCNDIAIRHYTENNVATIQSAGAQLGQYFSFFQDVFGVGGATLGEQLGDRMYLSIGLALMLVFVLAVFIIVLTKTKNNKLRLYTGMTFLTLFMASNLFPWDALSYYTPIGGFLAQIQFPWRYLECATMFSALSLGEMMIMAENRNAVSAKTYLPRQAALLLGVLACLLTTIDVLWLNSNYVSEGKDRAYVYNTAEIDIGARDFSHYMRYGSNINNLTYEVEAENASCFVTDRKGTSMALKAETYDKEGHISVPIFNYKGYHVSDEYGREYNIFDGANKEICFTLEPNFSGDIFIYFDAPDYWIAASIVSALFAAVLILAYIKRKNKENFRRSQV